jgi:hypothetical protein
MQRHPRSRHPSEYTLVSGTYTVKALNTYGMGLISSNRLQLSFPSSVNDIPTAYTFQRSRPIATSTISPCRTFYF